MAVFATVAVVGISTILQALRMGRIGAGFVLVMGPSEAFIAVCIMAIVEGGPALLATLIVASSLVPFALAKRLSWFQRFLTPAIVGTVIMLIPITILPALFNMLSVPGSPAPAAPLSALVTLLIVSGIVLKAKGILRFWSPARCLAAFSGYTMSIASLRLRGLACRGTHGRASISISGRLSGRFFPDSSSLP